MCTKHLLLIFAFLASLSCSLPILITPTVSAPLMPTVTSLPPTGTIEPMLTVTAVESIAPTGESQQPGLSLTKMQIQKDNDDPRYVIEANYPSLEGVPRSAVFNQKVEAFINEQVDQFPSDVAQLEGEWRQVESFLRIDYEVTFQSNQIISVLYTVSYLVAGAAHPGSDVHSMNYDVAMGRFVELPMLFVPDSNYLEIISRYCEDDLNQRGVLSWAEGLEPISANFETWNVRAESLLITFPPYQVAPGAAGILQVSVPLSELQPVIQPEGLLAALVD